MPPRSRGLASALRLTAVVGAVAILQAMDQLFHLLRQGIVAGGENTLQPPFVDGADWIPAIVMVSAHSLHN
jgi:hypothetical protein